MIYLRQPKCPLAQRLCMHTLCSSNPLKLLVALIAHLPYVSPLCSYRNTCTHRTCANTYAAKFIVPFYSTDYMHSQKIGDRFYLCLAGFR